MNTRKVKILIAGFSFKENCSDFRNTKVIDLFSFLKKRIETDIYDHCNKTDVKKFFRIDILSNLKNKKKYDVLIFAVPHKIFLETGLKKFMKN